MPTPERNAEIDARLAELAAEFTALIAERRGQSMLELFIEQRTERRPDAEGLHLPDFCAAFRASLQPREQRSWPIVIIHQELERSGWRVENRDWGKTIAGMVWKR